jgi:hypothetical protein
VVILAHEKFVFVAGGGNFGSGAVKFLLEKPEWKVVICDKNADCQASGLVRNSIKFGETKNALQMTGPTLFLGDAVETLVQLLLDGVIPDVIVPCVPFHFAGKALTSYLKKKSLNVHPSPELLKRGFEKSKLGGIEYRINEREALAVASKMPFNIRCAAGCSQPQICPVTKNELQRPMYDLVTELLKLGQADFIKVLRSRLMAPNVGGFSGDELKQSLDFCAKEEPETIALATSCSCHAVMNAFGIKA